MIRQIHDAGSIFLLSFALFGQSPAPAGFEVASIRPHQGLLHRIFGFSSSGPRVTLEAFPVKGLIMEAYNVKNYQVAFAPSVPESDDTYYDIVAKAEGDAARTRSEFRQMLQTLLADRFKLIVRREMQERPVYALVVGKSGPKFKPSAPDAEFAAHIGVNGRNQNITASSATLDFLAEKIWDSFSVDRPVVDRTGLAGTYDFKIEATPEFRINNNPVPADISIFTAVQEQLGLRLEARKARVEILVVDHMEKPSSN